jgi:pimeloyl-ACP methyl ester carboxylesterase
MKLIAFMGILLVNLACASSASRQNPLVIIHGAHFDGRSFYKLTNELNDIETLAVDLPNAGEDAATLTSYAQFICSKISQKSDILVHSQGGAVVNHALGLCSEKIGKIIFVASTIPFPMEKPFALFGEEDDKHYFRGVTLNEERGMFEITSPEEFAQAFAPEAKAKEVLALAKDEPMAPSEEKLNFSLKELQIRKKLIIITTEDKIITPATQMKYAARLQNAKIAKLQAGHLPMLVKPGELAQMVKGFLKN